MAKISEVQAGENAEMESAQSAICISDWALRIKQMGVK
jgi:hypothetical protein